MKKILSVFSVILVLFISSCSNEDDSMGQEDSSVVLVKKIRYEYEDEEFSYEVSYAYNGTKLVEGIYDNGDKEKYYYTGDLISKIEYIIDGVVEAHELFTYDASGRLIKQDYEELLDDFNESFLYEHNLNGTITTTYTSAFSNIGSIRTLSFENGEMSKIVHDQDNTYVYTYDTKNSPFKNVLGFAAIAYADHGDFELHGKNRNIVSIRDITNNSNYMMNTFQYNENGYPISVDSNAIFDYYYPNTIENQKTYFTYN